MLTFASDIEKHFISQSLEYYGLITPFIARVYVCRQSVM